MLINHEQGRMCEEALIGVRAEALTEVKMSILFFLVMTPYVLLSRYQPLGKKVLP
jgi:hypothetical protein